MAFWEDVLLVVRMVFFHTKVIDDTDETGARFLNSTPLEEIFG